MNKDSAGNAVADAAVNRPGYDALWAWFELSYASWLTIPRVLMHEMPDEWQARMAKLLAEYDEAHHHFMDLDPPIDTVVCCKVDGRYVKPPEWLLNYRHPDFGQIAMLKHIGGAPAKRAADPS